VPGGELGCGFAEAALVLGVGAGGVPGGELGCGFAEAVLTLGHASPRAIEPGGTPK